MFVTRSFAVYEPLSPYAHDGVGRLESLKSSSPSKSHAKVSVSPSSPPTVDAGAVEVHVAALGRGAVGAIDALRVALVRRVRADGRAPASVVSASGPAVTPSSLSAKTRQSRHWFARQPADAGGF